MLVGAPAQYRIEIHAPRRCLSYLPTHGSHESRTGRQLWPELALVVDLGLPGDVLNRAITLVAARLSDGPKAARAIIDAGCQVGLNSRTIQRATIQLGVIKQRNKFRGGWTWCLP